MLANIEPDTLEELFEQLSRGHQGIRPAGFRNHRNWFSPCYGFAHVLYRQVLYSRIGPARRRKLHQSVAEKARGRNGSRVGLSLRGRRCLATSSSQDQSYALMKLDRSYKGLEMNPQLRARSSDKTCKAGGITWRSTNCEN